MSRACFVILFTYGYQLPVSKSSCKQKSCCDFDDYDDEDEDDDDDDDDDEVSKKFLNFFIFAPKIMLSVNF